MTEYILGLDFKHMPPCQNVLLRKIDRTKILTKIIKNACDQTLNIQLTNEWYVDENGKLAIEYFTGNPYPGDITEFTINNEDEDEDVDDYVSDSDSDAYLSDDGP